MTIGSRPLLSRSGCIFNWILNSCSIQLVLIPFYRGAVVFNSFTENELCNIFEFSSPFIEERLYLKKGINGSADINVLVPFYRGAVVFHGVVRKPYINIR